MDRREDRFLVNQQFVELPPPEPEPPPPRRKLEWGPTSHIATDEDWMTAEEFRSWMEAGGWTTPRLAQRLRTTERTVFRWRSGQHPVNGLATRALAWAQRETPPDQRGAGEHKDKRDNFDPTPKRRRR